MVFKREVIKVQADGIESAYTASLSNLRGKADISRKKVNSVPLGLGA